MQDELRRPAGKPEPRVGDTVIMNGRLYEIAGIEGGKARLVELRKGKLEN